MLYSAKVNVMKKVVLFCSFLILALSAFTQKISRIDFDQILTKINDSTSTFFYPTLTKRLIDQDTTLTSIEFQHLYYGNVFQNVYHPYGATEKQKLFEQAYLQNNDFDEIERLGLLVLEENPINLKVMLKMIFLYNHTKSVGKAKQMATIYVGLLEVIYASGSGQSQADSFVVISVDDEYCITADLGLTVIKQTLVNSCDRLNFSKKGQHRKNRIKVLYFNVKMPLTYLSKSFQNSDLPSPDAAPDGEE